MKSDGNLTVYPGACGPTGNDSFIFILISFFMSAILLDTAERVTQNNPVILIKCGYGNLKPFKNLVFLGFLAQRVHFKMASCYEQPLSPDENWPYYTAKRSSSKCDVRREKIDIQSVAVFSSQTHSVLTFSIPSKIFFCISAGVPEKSQSN